MCFEIVNYWNCSKTLISQLFISFLAKIFLIFPTELCKKRQICSKIFLNRNNIVASHYRQTFEACFIKLSLLLSDICFPFVVNLDWFAFKFGKGWLPRRRNYFFSRTQKMWKIVSSKNVYFVLISYSWITPGHQEM